MSPLGLNCNVAGDGTRKFVPLPVACSREMRYCNFCVHMHILSVRAVSRGRERLMTSRVRVFGGGCLGSRLACS